MNRKQARNRTFRSRLGGLTAVVVAALIVVGGVSAAGNRNSAGASAHASLLSSVAFGHVTPPKGFLSLFTGSVGTAAGFEDDDANLAPDSITDWNSFAPTTWTGSAPTQTMTKTSGNWTLYGASDDTASTSDSGFAGGTKEDNACPTVIGSKAPNKDDLARVYIAGENLSGHVYLMLSWVRIPQNSTSSDEHVAFEFNQGTTACGSGGLVQRTAGDLLIVYDFTSGGTPTFSISKWVTSGSCEVGADSAPCWGPQQTISAAEGAVNTGGSVPDSIAPNSSLANPTTLGTSEFGEAGIDLTAATVNLSGGRACERFGTAFAVSRSSGSSSTAQMEDLVGPVNINLSNCVTPSISTTPSPASGNIGTKLNDTAQVTGGNGPTGIVTFSLYGPSDQTCAGTPLYTEADNLSGGSAATTGGPAAAAAGTYHWTATYNGDGNNNTTTSACADEAVTIARSSPTIATTPTPASGAIGATLNDTATVSGGSSPSGTVTFNLYGPADQTCSGNPLYTETGSLTAGHAATTGGPAAANAGTYHWQATYNGDAANNTASSACADEAVTIAKNSPTLATTLSATTATAGDTVHDSSALTGATADAGGTVTYTVYTNDTCSTGARDAGTKAVTNGVPADSNALVFNSAGTFYWQAVYSGDGNNNGATSPCKSEILTVGKKSPTIATTLSATTGAVGDTVHDSSALTGATADAGGTVTYTVYTNDTCSAGARDAGTKAVSGGVPADSNGLVFNTAGTFYWQAVYSGDANNNGATSPCQSEILTIGKNSPTIATTLSATTAAIGDTVHDSSALSGATANAGGTVTYTVYTNDTCSAGARDAGTKAVTGGVPADSSGLVFNAAGTFYWQAVYSGDANNNGATSPCKSEILNVGKNSPTIATTLSESSGSIGDTVNDTAVLTGATSDAGGTVTYTAYTNDSCTAGARDAGTKAVTNGVVADSNGLVFNAAGTYYWQAVYTGDANNGPATSPCKSEILTIGKNSPTLATVLSESAGSIGDTVNDTAQLTGATSDAGGTVTYTAYSDNQCSADARDAGTKVVTNGVVADSDGLTFDAAGTFYWQAVYSGDANNDGATSPCRSEVLTIAKNGPTISTTLSAGEVVTGSTVHDSSTLDGATSDAGGTVTYSVYTNNECSGDGRDAGTKDVTDGQPADSDPLEFDTAGTFYWQAVYSGDANNQGARSSCTEEKLSVDNPAIAITKNPKSQAVNSGGTATFTITVTNTGTVALTSVTVSDALAPNCAKTIGDLAKGASSSYTCTLANVTSPFTNTATATGHPPVGPDVTATDTANVTVNPPPPPPPPAPPAPKIDLAIVKAVTPASSTLGDRVTWTLTVTNNGPDGATGVTVADPIPAGMRYISSTTTQGTCSITAMLSCQLGSMASGATVTITILTASTATGQIINTATVVGNEPETNTANNTATAQAQVKGAFVPPAPVCTAVGVAPKQLLVGHKSTLRLRVTQKGEGVKGIRVQIHGATLGIVTAPSNGKGLVTRSVRPMKAGIVVFRPVAKKGCRVTRIGVIGVFTPPVTG